ncbi:uncharacterized protein LOC131329542 [Rhododendron vialii]|uniref:uncharacterized protein LOC131329542 n=1 Tax=Rhododendron vialii TaxID=182163 RepID=UPI00265D813B|nr:uncharacterized protein LOC131329542 [Rhododendron vialii]
MALRSSLSFFLFLLLFFSALSNSGRPILAQATIPARFDGFVYENRPISTDSILIEAFFDPICPDSRDAWPPLKQALDFYGQRVYLTVHPFPLPYHDNAFVSSRALHIINELNTSATYDLLELFFEHQKEFYNQPTFNLSRATVVSRVVTLATSAVGNSYYSAVASGFTDQNSDLMTRVSFKYGCSRGVFGTPFFFVNGFALPDAGSAIDYNHWRSIIDPLVQKQGTKREEFPHFVL